MFFVFDMSRDNFGVFFLKHPVFLASYTAPDSKVEILFFSIKNMFSRLSLTFSKLQGYCFDGASNMSS